MAVVGLGLLGGWVKLGVGMDTIKVLHVIKHMYTYEYIRHAAYPPSCMVSMASAMRSREMSE